MLNYLKETNRFLQEYGFEGYKIISAYEEACNIKCENRYSQWYGDLGLFEPSLNEKITYAKLYERYKEGLKYLGIINEQVDVICEEFLSSQLSEHIKEEKKNSEVNKDYSINTIISKRNVFELSDINLEVDIDFDLEVNEDCEINAIFNCWFDADKKFAMKIPENTDEWVRLYCAYNPFKDTVKVTCALEDTGSRKYFPYIPIENEGKIMKKLITETIRDMYNQTPQEYCNKIHFAEELSQEQASTNVEQTMGGM